MNAHIRVQKGQKSYCLLTCITSVVTTELKLNLIVMQDQIEVIHYCILRQYYLPTAVIHCSWYQFHVCSFFFTACYFLDGHIINFFKKWYDLVCVNIFHSHFSNYCIYQYNYLYRQHHKLFLDCQQ